MKHRLRWFILRRYGTWKRCPKLLIIAYTVASVFRICISQTELLVMTPWVSFRWMEEHRSPEVDFMQSGIEVRWMPTSWTFRYDPGCSFYRFCWREIWMSSMELQR